MKRLNLSLVMICLFVTLGSCNKSKEEAAATETLVPATTNVDLINEIGFTYMDHDSDYSYRFPDGLKFYDVSGSVEGLKALSLPQFFKYEDQSEFDASIFHSTLFGYDSDLFANVCVTSTYGAIQDKERFMQDELSTCAQFFEYGIYYGKTIAPPTVSQSTLTDDGYVLSGYCEGAVFYSKTLFTHKKGASDVTAVTVRYFYDEGEDDVYSLMIKPIFESFKVK